MAIKDDPRKMVLGLYVYKSTRVGFLSNYTVRVPVYIPNFRHTPDASRGGGEGEGEDAMGEFLI